MFIYKHDKSDVQKVAVELTDFVSARLEASYSGVFQHLRNVVQSERFHNGEVVVRRSPFTSFFVTLSLQLSASSRPRRL